MPPLPCHNLPVYTAAGRHLGRVVDVDIDPLTQMVENYHVAPVSPLPALWRGRLIIGRGQVVEVSKDRLVVRDTVNPIEAVVETRLAADPS